MPAGHRGPARAKREIFATIGLSITEALLSSIRISEASTGRTKGSIWPPNSPLRSAF